jgi:hypothetical protein
VIIIRDMSTKEQTEIPAEMALEELGQRLNRS